jgi:hypothetical protein
MLVNVLADIKRAIVETPVLSLVVDQSDRWLSPEVSFDGQEKGGGRNNRWSADCQVFISHQKKYKTYAGT